MSIRVLVIEDEMLVAEDIATDLADFGFEVVDTLISGEECLLRFHELNPDVVIMDLQIKGAFDGIETARRLNEHKTVPVVYLTANSDKQTISRILENFPAPFISKPYNRNDLMMAIEVAFAAYNKRKIPEPVKEETDSVFIKSGQQYKKVKLTDILYLEASGSYTKVYTLNDEYLISYNLSYFEETVQHHLFKRIHRSYIINIDHVTAIETSSVIVNNKILPISKAFYKDIMACFKKL
jgi:DNA-binding LytR/AlgR family response regulator